MRSLFLSALLLTASAASADSLQEQVDALKKEIKYIQDNYERSEPIEIVKPVTEYVSPSGEIFMTLPKGGVSPTDGSKLEERVTYRKLKFNRREAVGEKIDAAVNAAIDGHVIVGLELLGVYQNQLGAGDYFDSNGEVARNANHGMASSGVDFNLTGKPMRNTLMFVNFDAADGTASLSEAWVSVQGPKKVLSLQAGLIDLTGTFDSNKIANDETSQFMTGDFVNNAILMNPDNAPGAVIRADFTRYHFAVGAQETGLGGADFFDSLYWVAEAGMLYNLVGDGHIRVWARQQPRNYEQPDQAVGGSWDHRLSTCLTVFGRYAKSSYVESYDELTDTRVAINPLDWTASGGLELGYFSKHRLRDKTGLAYGRTDQQGGASEQFAELYYRSVLTPNVSLSLHGQGLFSRTVADAGAAALDPVSGDPTLNDALPNAWTAGIRALVSY